MRISMPGSNSPLGIQLSEPKQVMDTSPPPAEGNQFTLYIAKLPSNMTNEELRAMFELCGPIVSTNALNDKRGTASSVGFVNFATAEARGAAMKFNGVQPDGWDIKMTLYDQEKKKEEQKVPQQFVPNVPGPMFPHTPFHLTGAPIVPPHAFRPQYIPHHIGRQGYIPNIPMCIPPMVPYPRNLPGGHMLHNLPQIYNAPQPQFSPVRPPVKVSRDIGNEIQMNFQVTTVAHGNVPSSPHNTNNQKSSQVSRDCFRNLNP